MKEEYDGAEPTATSVSALNTLTLAHLTGDRRWRERAVAAIESFGSRLQSQGRSVPLMAAALSTALTPSRRSSSSGRASATTRVRCGGASSARCGRSP